MSFASCTNTSTAVGSWSKDADSGFRYHARDCLLVRPSASRVRKCLRHRHLLFVGDSLQRYLYLTLANFLVTGEWPRDLKAGERSPCFEGAYALNKTRDEVWPEYFRGTNSDLRGAEICDCFRTTCCSGAVLNENRYTLFDSAAVSFVSQMVSPGWEVHGSTLPDSWPRMRASTTCTPGECVATSTGRNRPWRIGASANMPDKRWAWSEPLPDFLRTTMPHLGVTDVLFNPGHHYNPDTTRDSCGACSIVRCEARRIAHGGALPPHGSGEVLAPPHAKASLSASRAPRVSRTRWVWASWTCSRCSCSYQGSSSLLTGLSPRARSSMGCTCSVASIASYSSSC